MTNLVSIFYRPDSARRSTLRLWLAVLAGACALYFATAQRGTSWQDSGMFQWRSLQGDYTGDLGLALAHPLYVAAGRAIAVLSGRNLPLLLNCFSGLGMAVALANLAAVAVVLTGRMWIGAAVAAVTAVAHTTWWLSTVAEVYTWSAAGLTCELLLLVLLLREPHWALLAGLALVNGLGLCVHNFALLPLPVYAAVAVWLTAKRRLPAWSLAAAAGAWVAGAGLFLGLMVQLAVSSGSLAEAVRSALFGKYAKQVLNLGDGSRHWQENAALTAMNFANVLLPLAVIGWVRMRRIAGGPTAAVLAAITIIQIAFFARYPVEDQFTFVLPSVVMIALAAGVGLRALAALSRGWVLAGAAACLLSVAGQPVFYAAAPALLQRVAGPIRRERLLPFRDEARYYLVPWKQGERSAERFSAAAIDQAAPNGVILAHTDGTVAYPLLVYQTLSGSQPAVTVQFKGGPLPSYDRDPAAFRQALGKRRLYVVSPAPGRVPEALLQDAEFEKPPGGILYQVHWRTPD